MQPLKLSKLISEESIQNRVKEIGGLITDQFHDKDLTAVCVLNGSFIFYADLIREIETDLICEFFGVSSYMDSHISSGEVKLTMDLSTPIENKHVLLVEDIVDSGLTMSYLQKNLKTRNPKSITTITLLHKPEAQKEDCKLDHVGFEIGNEFVVGYGLDYQSQFRNLPYIAQVHNII